MKDVNDADTKQSAFLSDFFFVNLNAHSIYSMIECHSFYINSYPGSTISPNPQP